MTRKEALELFSLTNGFEDDDLQDALDDALFLLRKEVMQKYMVPQLLDKIIRQAMIQQEAFEFLSEAQFLPVSKEPFSFSFEKERLGFLRQYEAERSRCFLQVSSSKNLPRLITAMRELLDLQKAYMDAFLVSFSEENPSSDNIKSRDIIDTGQLIHALDHKQHDVANRLISIEKKRVVTLKAL